MTVGIDSAGWPDGMTVAQATHIANTYGLEPWDYADILKSQDFRCACCGSLDPRGSKSGFFVVDHCHATGRVRGLICQTCNQAIGKLGDNIKGVRNALLYLMGVISESSNYSVFKAKGRRFFYVQWRDKTGKLRTKSLRTSDRTEALTKAAEMFGADVGKSGLASGPPFWLGAIAH